MGTAASPASPLGSFPQLWELRSSGPVGEISLLVSKQGCLSTLAQQAGSGENELRKPSFPEAQAILRAVASRHRDFHTP